ncbi:MAG: hypothetical protein NTX57_16865 [Armatimonadetes bacterium]|nr:hypothetical protein [Armatimonadota bacterium]
MSPILELIVKATVLLALALLLEAVALRRARSLAGGEGGENGHAGEGMHACAGRTSGTTGTTL